MTDPSPDCGYTVGPSEQVLWEEIFRLREFGEHYSGAAQDAWDRIAVLEKALREIEKRGSRLIHYYKHDRPPREELTKDAQIARAALAAGSASPGGAET